MTDTNNEYYYSSVEVPAIRTQPSLPVIEEDEIMMNLRKEPTKRNFRKPNKKLMKRDAFILLKENLTFLYCNLLDFENDGNQWIRSAVRRDGRVLKLADALFKMGVANRWMHDHTKKWENVRKLSDDPNYPALEELLERAEGVKRQQREDFIVQEEIYLEEVDKYIQQYKVQDWIKTIKAKTESMKKLGRHMFQLDHEDFAVEQWKRGYYEESVVIEKLVGGCFKLLTNDPNEQMYDSMADFLATLNK